MEEAELSVFVERIIKSSNRIHLVGLADRPGLSSFFAAIEYHFYPPGTSKNELFDLWAIKWESLMWQVISIPSDKMGAIRQMASMMRLRISDGVPTMLGGTPEPGDRVWEGCAVKFFPGSQLPDGTDNRSMYGVESTRENPLHNKESPTNIQLVRRREGRVIEAFERHARPKPLEIYNFIYGFEPHPKWLPEGV
jgi:hypothetical protein